MKVETAAIQAASEDLHARVQRFMQQSLGGHSAEAAESFDELACALARHQARHIPALAQLHRARGLDPDALTRAADIPAVVTEAFRHRRIAVHPEELDERCFLTSGTSAGVAERGRHPLRTTASYRQAAVRWGRTMLFPDRTDLGLVALVESEQQAPASSLSFMLARFGEQLQGEVSFHWDGRQLDLYGVLTRCRLAMVTARPLLVAGTSFALFFLCQAIAARHLSLPLPPGSRLMLTGGFKGRMHQVSEAELIGRMAGLFNVRPSHIVGEYGMTELSSQLYQSNLVEALANRREGQPGAAAARYRPPPWLRASAVDPSTLQPLPAGEIGLCRLVDLANVDSAVAIQTADQVKLDRDGSLVLLGRQPGAPPRGCSLALEHLLEGP